MKFKIKSTHFLVALTCFTLFLMFYVQYMTKNSKKKYEKRYILSFLGDFGNTTNIEKEIDTTYLPNNCDCKKDNRVVIRRNDNFSSIFLENSNEDPKHLYDLSKEELEKSIFTCDFYNSFRRGKSQKVISYSLYGKNRFFYDKLKKITNQLKSLYPGWTMRIYYDKTIDKSITCEIECQKDHDGNLLDNVDFCDINNFQFKFEHTKNSTQTTVDAYYIHSMIWRWFPIGDSFVDVFSSRDTDSFLLQREVDSVNVWLKSDKVGHIMRDHPWHGTSILGGMWGFFNARDRSLAKRIFELFLDKKISSQFNQGLKSPKGSDQQFLAEHVYPTLRSNSITHDSYLCGSYGGSPFPTKRLGNCYIGGVAACDFNATFYECPSQCRPQQHQDWKYC